MMDFRIADLLELPHVAYIGASPAAGAKIAGFSTDSRTVKKGEVFIALRGESFDGHDFLFDAVERGAALCVVDARGRGRLAPMPAFPCLVVRDTLETYGDAARTYRRRFDVPILAVTGSNGKTGTKDLIARVLGGRRRVLSTEANFNNRIGVPATLLRLLPRHEAAVLELGTNQPGDIPYLCSVCEPTHGLITNVGRAHTEKLLSREGIAAEKGALYKALPPDGVAFINADEPLLRAQTRKRGERVSFGMSRRADVRISDLQLDEDARPIILIEAPLFEKAPVVLKLRMSGRHAAFAAAAALAVGWTFGCETLAMKEAIEKHRSRSGRMEVIRAGAIRIIDDAYNANPDSMIAAVETLASMKAAGKRIAVLGDMLELGRGARDGHRAVGERIASLDIQVLFTYGRKARSIGVPARSAGRIIRHFDDENELIDCLRSVLAPGDLVLVRGSRGVRLDAVVSRLCAANHGARRFSEC